MERDANHGVETQRPQKVGDFIKLWSDFLGDEIWVELRGKRPSEQRLDALIKTATERAKSKWSDILEEVDEIKLPVKEV